MMNKIDVNEITDRQKLIIRNGLNTYKYIMDNKNNINEDFKKRIHRFLFIISTNYESKRK